MISRVHVNSTSQENSAYLVTLIGNQAVACTCPDFNYRGESASYTCKHMRQADRQANTLSASEIARLRQLLAG